MERLVRILSYGKSLSFETRIRSLFEFEFQYFGQAAWDSFELPVINMINEELDLGKTQRFKLEQPAIRE